jgi:hypothetical protein
MDAAESQQNSQVFLQWTSFLQTSPHSDDLPVATAQAVMPLSLQSFSQVSLQQVFLPSASPALTRNFTPQRLGTYRITSLAEVHSLKNERLSK